MRGPFMEEVTAAPLGCLDDFARMFPLHGNGTVDHGAVSHPTLADPCPLRNCHKMFRGAVKWGHTSMGWSFGFKLRLLIHDQGRIMAVRIPR